MSHPRRRLQYLLLILSFFITVSCAQSLKPVLYPPHTPRIALSPAPDAFYQQLPIADMDYGLDGKLWLNVPARPAPLTPEILRDQLANEFHQSQRQFSFNPILIEPSGRIWTSYPYTPSDATTQPRPKTATTLLAYDGHAFITHELPVAFQNLRKKYDNNFATAAYADHTAFFAVSDSLYHAVISFDGTTWAEEKLPLDRNTPIRLYPELDGNGLIAIGSDTAQIWRWRAGTWSHLELPAARGNPNFEHPRIQAVTVLPSGVWMATTKGLARIPFFTGEDPFFARLFRDLRSANPAARAAASRLLVARADPRPIQAARDAGGPPDFLKQLDDILQALKTNNTPRPFAVGQFALTGLREIVPLPDGSALIPAAGIRDLLAPANKNAPQTPTPGIIKMAPDTSATLFAGPDLFNEIDSRDGTFFLPVDQGKAVWLLGPYQAPHPVLLDLATGKVRRRLVGPPLGFFLAALPDGTLIFTSPNGGSPIVTAWNTALRHDPRIRLATTPLALVPPPNAVDLVKTADNFFWFGASAAPRSFVIGRSDGISQQAAPIATIPKSVCLLFPGANALLVEGHDVSSGSAVPDSNAVYLVTPGQTLSARTREDLLTSFTQPFIAAWKLQKPDGQSHADIQIDNQNHIWTIRGTREQTLAVLADGKWIAPDGPAAKLIASRKTFDGMYLVGDGSHIYIASPGYLASIAGGHIQLSVVPALSRIVEHNNSSPAKVVPAPDGSLWFASPGPNYSIVAAHVDHTGLLDSIPNIEPRAFDSRGRLWAIDRTPGRPPSLALFLNKQRVNVPDFAHVEPAGEIIPLSTGNVLVVTPIGLQEFTRAPRNASPFTRGRIFLPGNHWSRESRLAFSPTSNTFCLYYSDPPTFFRVP